jgi:hypothetical protein
MIFLNATPNFMLATNKIIQYTVAWMGYLSHPITEQPYLKGCEQGRTDVSESKIQDTT